MALVALFVALVFCSSSPWGSSSSSSSGSSSSSFSSGIHTKRIHLYGHLGNSTRFDVPPVGVVNAGDGTTWLSPIFADAKQTRRVGESVGICTRTNADPVYRAYICSWTMSLEPHGTLSMQSYQLSGVNDEQETWAVVGGTKRWRAARGEMTQTFLDSGLVILRGTLE